LLPSKVPAVREFDWGVEIDIRVIPRARRHAMAGVRGAALLIRLAAPPLGGAANHALVDFLATLLSVPRRTVRIVSGVHSRRKRIAIDGAIAETILRKIRLCSPIS
jgi:hypothetical protein